MTEERAKSGLSGFNNLEVIKSAITHLYSRFGYSNIKSYRENFNISLGNPRYNGGSIVATQKLATDIAAHYRLPITTVIVNYSEKLNCPGRVELGAGNEFFVELQAIYRDRINSVAGILAHEIAHIFLHRYGASWGDQKRNEILTDTTAAYLGFGVTIMNATFYQFTTGGKTPEMTSEYFGYLSPEEFGYIVSRRDDAFNLISRENIGNQQWKQAYDCGQRKMRREQEERPFLPSAWYEKIFNLLLKRNQSSPESIQIECLTCSKKLRIPSLNKKIVVNCPNCDARFFCYP